MARQSRKITGAYGESLATDFLLNKGYTLITKNWRCSIGEIDIIVQDSDTLVFVEVRTKHGTRNGTPEDSITPKKQAKLIELAYSYLAEMDTPTDSWRIDVVAVVLDSANQLLRITHLPSAVGE